MAERLGQVSLQMVRKDFSLDVQFDIPARGVLGLFGPSGCGKTTLLRCLAGLEHHATGRIRINGDTWLDSDTGQCAPAASRAIAYVFQDGRLFPHLDVAGNLAYGDKRRGDRAPVATLDEVVALLDIGHLMEKRPDALSGGEQQRVAIGRALLSAPRLLLMDEPLANLDRRRKLEILPYLDRLHSHLRIPMIYVSHSLNEVSRLCDDIVLLEGGRVLAAGKLETVFADLDVAAGFGDMAGVVLPVHSEGWNEAEGLTVLTLGDERLRIPEQLDAGKLRLRIQANDVSIVLDRPRASSILNILPATVREIRESTGAMVLVRLDLAGHDLLARLSKVSLRQLELANDMPVHVQIKGAAIRR